MNLTDIIKKIKLAQINCTVGDITLNASRIINTANTNNGLIIFPELAITGYSPKDMLLKKHFIDEAYNALYDIAYATADSRSTLVIGCPHRIFRDVYNAAFLVKGGSFRLISGKKNLPTYSVFDEERYFKSSDVTEIFEYKDIKFGVVVCEDLWTPEKCSLLRESGARAIIAINASPYRAGIKEKTH